jgi:hypothetical protein
MISSRRRLVLPLAVLAVASSVGPAFAADGDGGSGALTATLTAGSIGSRSVTSVSPVALTTALSTSTASGTMAAVVTEAARGGTNSWSLTATSSALTGPAGSTAIPATALAVSNRAVTQVAGGGTAAAATGSSALNTAATLFTTTGQSVESLYTGTYAASGTITLTVPNGQAVGAYSGTLTVSLI